jgi:HEPN domain-containing protein
MPIDPALLAETRAWFKRAAEDLRAAEHSLLAKPPLLEDLLFHCQQAAEKALKGFLVWHSRPFRKTRSLEEIGELCLGIDPTLRPIVDPLVPLTQYAWEFRYPGDSEQPSAQEADEALSLVRQAYRCLLSLLPKEIHSGLDRNL